MFFLLYPLLPPHSINHQCYSRHIKNPLTPVTWSYFFTDFFFRYLWTVMKQYSVKNNYSSKLMWPLPMLTNTALEHCQYPKDTVCPAQIKTISPKGNHHFNFWDKHFLAFLYGFTTDVPIPKQCSLVLPVLSLFYYVHSFVACCFCSELFVRSIHVVTYS